MVELIPQLSPTLEAPYHLEPYTRELDLAIERARAGTETYKGLVFGAPPQHGKTISTEHGLVKALLSVQNKSHAYVTFSYGATLKVQLETRRILEPLGITIEGTQSFWRVPFSNSTVRWTSIDGVLTGDPVNGLLVVDDPFKNYDEARSAVERNSRWGWLNSTATTRLHLGSTVIIMATRWVPGDISGLAIKKLGWPYINIQAICDDPATDPIGRQLGEPLWPKKHPLEVLLLHKRADPFIFRAMYQGEPQEVGAALFETPKRFTDLPPHNTFIAAWGVDLAYSTKTISDWSVMVYGRRIKSPEGDKLYIMRVVRKQVDVTHFLDTMVTETQLKPAALRFYYGGTELGVSSFISKKVKNFHAIQASADKVTRSQSAREWWNLGNIVVPEVDSPYWTQDMEAFIEEITQFTGAGDTHDDCIDACAALADQLCKGQLDWKTVNAWQSQIGGFRL